MQRRFLLLIIGVLFAFSGCGYQIAGGKRTPLDLPSLSVPVFENSTVKPDIEGIITEAFISELISSVVIVNDGQAVMSGVIKEYGLTPVSFTQTDVNQEYRLTVAVSLTITRKSDNKILWMDGNIIETEDFVVNINDVNATKDAEENALRKLSADMARTIEERLLENI